MFWMNFASLARIFATTHLCHSCLRIKFTQQEKKAFVPVKPVMGRRWLIIEIMGNAFHSSHTQVLDAIGGHQLHDAVMLHFSYFILFAVVHMPKCPGCIYFLQYAWVTLSKRQAVRRQTYSERSVFSCQRLQNKCLFIKTVPCQTGLEMCHQAVQPCSTGLQRWCWDRWGSASQSHASAVQSEEQPISN